MPLTRYRWKLPSTESNETLKAPKQAEEKYSSAFLRLCLARGLDSETKIAEATDQTPNLFHDPFLFYQMDVAVERLQQAIANGEQIVIYGDYDADGITSTLILYEGLENLGANVRYYLPNRLVDGYGPNLERYRQLIDDGAQLILTCDNGVAGHEAIDYANQQEVDVIITDHHALPEELPSAYAIIHPSHPKGAYPFSDLSGAGVALKLMSALLDEVPTEALELVAIGTIADLVSLTDENRTLVISGLKLMNESQRIGLRLLLDNVNESVVIDEDTIGFRVAPRLNAIGRLGDPTPGLELLHTFDEVRAQELKTLLEQKNDERKEIVEQITQELLQQLSQEAVPNVIIAGSSKWHPGVLGIVASRIKDQYHRPTLLFHYNEETQNYVGSGRSIEGIHLVDWLQTNNQWIEQYGGHDQAAGLTVSKTHWSAFQEAMLASSTQYQEAIDALPTLSIDCSLSVAEATQTFIEEMNQLGPFGTDNPKPIVHLPQVTIQQKRALGADQSHLKLVVNDQAQAHRLDIIGFSLAEAYQSLQVGNVIDVVGSLNLNYWQGHVTPQLQLLDLGMDGSHWIDERGSQIPADFFKYDHALYLFAHEQLADHYRPQIVATSQATTYAQLKADLNDSLTALVIVEPPIQIDSLQQQLESHRWQRVILGAYVSDSRYLAGGIERQDFAHLYRYLSQVKQFQMKDLSHLSQQLQLPLIKLRAMLNVFYQAKFVIIEAGEITFSPNISEEKVDLTQLSAYQQYHQAMEAEKLLIYRPLNEVKEYFEK